jgi:hypothetical protein
LTPEGVASSPVLSIDVYPFAETFQRPCSGIRALEGFAPLLSFRLFAIVSA